MARMYLELKKNIRYYISLISLLWPNDIKKYIDTKFYLVTMLLKARFTCVILMLHFSYVFFDFLKAKLFNDKGFVCTYLRQERMAFSVNLDMLEFTYGFQTFHVVFVV